jgi:hypothetical protein
LRKLNWEKILLQLRFLRRQLSSLAG